jgi:hypothetical protein
VLNFRESLNHEQQTHGAGMLEVFRPVLDHFSSDSANLSISIPDSKPRDQPAQAACCRCRTFKTSKQAARYITATAALLKAEPVSSARRPDNFTKSPADSDRLAIPACLPTAGWPKHCLAQYGIQLKSLRTDYQNHNR